MSTPSVLAPGLAPGFGPGLVAGLVAGLVTVLTGSFDARAASPVSLSFADDAYEGSYTQAVPLVLTFRDETGTPIDGTANGACGSQPCRVSVTVQRDDEGDGAERPLIRITDPDVAVGADGIARVRLTLVDGRHGGGVFVGDDDGVPYTLQARFLGSGAPLPDNDDADCQPGAGVADGRLCPTNASASLSIEAEVPDLSFGQDVVLGLGESVTLAVTLVDSDGDADIGGEAIDGTSAKLLEGLPVTFFYDVNNNGRPDGSEQLGQGTTNSLGVAAFEFTADPSFVTAGTFNAGLHAEFSGDDRYGVARTSTRIVVNAGGPVADATIIELTPAIIQGNGVDESTIRVRLVDQFGNLLGPDAEIADVDITTDLGLLIDGVERDPLDGTYEQVLRAPRGGGTATITVTVNGEPAGTKKLTIEGAEGGCNCQSLHSSLPFAVGLLGLTALRRR